MGGERDGRDGREPHPLVASHTRSLPAGGEPNRDPASDALTIGLTSQGRWEFPKSARLALKWPGKQMERLRFDVQRATTDR